MVYPFIGLWIFLLAATITGYIFHACRQSEESVTVIKRTHSWWVILGVFTLLCFMGDIVSAVILGALGVLSLREIFRVSNAGNVYAAIIALLMLISLASGWKILASSMGCEKFFFLVVCAQLNDVAQYLWGKSLGKHLILPTISPSKTWEGFLGGMFSSVGIALLLSMYTLHLPPLSAGLLGVIIAVLGFMGDITVSAFKRHSHIKDMGTLISGHGGVMDRIDSLLYNTPLFLIYCHYTM